MKSEGAAIGFAFDGDGDRFFAIDDRGEFISGDFLTAIMGQYLLEKYPKSKIFMMCGHRGQWLTSSQRLAAPLNGKGRARLSSNNAWRRRDALYAGEVTGHYYFKDFFFADSGIIPSLILMEMISKKGKKMSEILAPLDTKYFISGEINSKVADTKAVMQKLAEVYKDGEQHTMDGISVSYPTWHFNVRGSNTEPLIRLNLEAKTKEEMERKRDEVLAVIRG